MSSYRGEMSRTPILSWRWKKAKDRRRILQTGLFLSARIRLDRRAPRPYRIVNQPAIRKNNRISTRTVEVSGRFL